MEMQKYYAVPLKTTCILARQHYTFTQVLKTPRQAEYRTRQTCGIFMPTELLMFSVGRECEEYNTRKGNNSAHLVLGFQLLAALMKTGIKDFRQGANQMNTAAHALPVHAITYKIDTAYWTTSAPTPTTRPETTAETLAAVAATLTALAEKAAAYNKPVTPAAPEYISPEQYRYLQEQVYYLSQYFHHRNGATCAAWKLLRQEFGIDSAAKLPANKYQAAVTRLLQLQDQAATYRAKVSDFERKHILRKAFSFAVTDQEWQDLAQDVDALQID